MHQRKLGNSGLQVSEISFGCMSIGTEETKAQSLLNAAFEQGVTFFDTADLYDQGQNEALVGKTFAHRRHEVVIGTKVGNRFEPGKPGWTWDVSQAYIHHAVEQSLRRLQTDYIDLYQIHGGTLEDPFDEVVDTLERLKEKGWIRAYGISSIRPNVIKRYLGGSNISSIMMQYSLLDRRPEEWFETIEKHGVSVIARGPIARGLLSGTKPIANDDTYVDRTAAEIRGAVDAVKQISLTRTPTETSLRYALAPDVVATVIPGASSIEQLQKNVATQQSKPLSNSELAHLRGAVRPHQYQQHRD